MRTSTCTLIVACLLAAGTLPAWSQSATSEGGSADEEFNWDLNVETVPAGFPRFDVPGHEAALQSFRELFYSHYLFMFGATMWDTWIPQSILWPAVPGDERPPKFRAGVRKLLSICHLDPDGYVSTHQHWGYAHPDGWPFPLWTQVAGAGWQFVRYNTMLGYGPESNLFLSPDASMFALTGVEDQGVDTTTGWQGRITAAWASIETPAIEVKGASMPFVVLHWEPEQFGPRSVCYVEWQTATRTAYGPGQRMYFTPKNTDFRAAYTTIPVYHVLGADETVTRFRLVFEGAAGARFAFSALHTAVDSRHPINNFAYLQGCHDYLVWTADINFLRQEIGRMRTALRYALGEFQVRTEHVVSVPWPGHDGRSGWERNAEGELAPMHGRGIGGCYYDIVPFGGKDSYATAYLYDTLGKMAAIEATVANHPEWNIPGAALAFEPERLRRLADKVRQKAQKLFWNEETRRFVSSVDIDGNRYDYGFVFSNLELVHYGVASDAQARDVMDWISGRWIVPGDTSQGEDIYRWRFGPRLTTKRNLEYYPSMWVAETFAWGDQVQDGGAVLGWSYFDLMDRLKVYGPDNAWRRLAEIIAWYDDVQAEGGYRAYYSKPGRGNLQGGNVPGGLGLDKEFIESVLLPQVMLYGFLGLEPGLDTLTIAPRLPQDWPELTVTNVRWQGAEMDITAPATGPVRVVVHRGDAGRLADRVTSPGRAVVVEP